MTRLRRDGGTTGVDSGGAARREMRLSWVLTVLSICLSALVTATGTEGKRKLQIGVKKRVDHCPIKSRKGDVLHMHYTGKLEDGTEFDSSLPQNQPFVFSLGTGQVIKGWDQGLLGMCEGEKRKLVIPSELGYGERGAPPKIPGNRPFCPPPHLLHPFHLQVALVLILLPPLPCRWCNLGVRGGTAQNRATFRTVAKLERGGGEPDVERPQQRPLL
uniref:peptidylprolyl isomerase n=1 Tax=Capra hircus TaxID=9925 RepID=A0A8C2PGB7_CAPHI